jgi:hypothetical protein
VFPRTGGVKYTLGNNDQESAVMVFTGAFKEPVEYDDVLGVVLA